MARPHIELGDGRWHLWRLADDEFISLGQHALPIDQNFALLLLLKRQALQVGAELSLGGALTVLERKFGPSSTLFDSCRTSFSFPLLLTFERQRRVSYLLRCHDHRGELHFPMYRVLPGDPSARERSVSHPPVVGEFSREEMDEFVTGLHGYLLGYCRLLSSELVAAFFRAIRSDLVLYGYDGSGFFEQSYNSCTDFDRARLELETRFGSTRQRSLSNRVERMIDRVTEMPGGGSPLKEASSGGRTSTEMHGGGNPSTETHGGGNPSTETHGGGN